MEDLSDSKEMLKAEEPVFIMIIVGLVLLILSISLTWMYFGKIDVVVRANGIVRPSQEISTIRNIQEGYVDQINFYMNKKVKRNEILYSINSFNLKSEKEIFINRKSKLRNEIELLNKLKKKYY